MKKIPMRSCVVTREKCQKQKILNKVFEMEVPDNIFEEILNEINE